MRRGRRPAGHRGDDAVSFLQTIEDFGKNPVADSRLDLHRARLGTSQDIHRALGRNVRPACPDVRRTPVGWRGHIRRPKAQRSVTDLQGVVPLRADDRDVRGHAGLQFQVGIIDADDGVVGDDVLHRNRRIAHLHDLAVEGALGKSIYRKIDLLPRFHRPDVRFGHVGVDLHLCRGHWRS